MSKNNEYRLVKCGNKAMRRDYSQASGSLQLPNLVEIQTSSFDWFVKEGMEEVFKEVYPISNFNGNITLRYLSSELGQPKYDIDECKSRETTYSAPLRAKMELEIEDESHEVLVKNEEVFLGEFPMMTPTGTFIINGAERVIVSQIVRSPGAYFSLSSDDKTGADIYASELIPSRGTWLEFMTDDKKSNNGRIMNMSVDRKRKILSTIMFKAIGAGLNVMRGENTMDSSDFKKFMAAFSWPVNDVEISEEGEQRDFLNDYLLMYTGIFGNYEEIANTLVADKLNDSDHSLLAIYENQRSDEIPTLDGSYNLMNAKFFDDRRYDLIKAGRYKITKKLGCYARAKGKYLASDLRDENGKLVVKANELVTKEKLALIKQTLAKGLYMQALPQKFEFSHPDIVAVPANYGTALIGRILAAPVEYRRYRFDQGTVLTPSDVKDLARSNLILSVYGGVIAQGVKLTKTNVMAVMNYGSRLYSLGRLVDEKGNDVCEDNDDLLIDRYLPDVQNPSITNEVKKTIIDSVKMGGEYTLYLVGAANQVIYVKNKPEDETAVKVIGIDPLTLKKTIIISDMYAQYSYILNMTDDIGVADDIDQLGNRRIRTVGELIQNQFRIGLSRMEKNVKERMSISEVSMLTPKNLTNIRSLTMAIKEFYSSSQLSQFMDQQNPLAELTNKRRISALGPGGLTRERAGFEVRDVHSTHYGRICPIETPEGPNIGLINYLTTYAKVNEYGFIQTPYRVVRDKCKVSDEIIYMSADDELDYVIAQANEVRNGILCNDQCVCRYQTETLMFPKENDDASRALMGANMQRQAVPLLNPHAPLVGTGIEAHIAKDSGSGIVAAKGGVVTFVDATQIVVDEGKGSEHTYKLRRNLHQPASYCPDR